MIEIREVSKSFDGLPALREVSFTVPTGAIYGFIGPNGAGKTTTLKIIGTLLRPDGGTVRVMDTDALNDPMEVRRIVGWMPDQYGVYADLRVWEYLDFYAGAYGLPRSKRRAITGAVLDLVGLSEKRECRVGTLSRGMTQRLCLGRALLHEPPILLLDEPASGLDPQARIELRELLRELQRMGKTQCRSLKPVSRREMVESPLERREGGPDGTGIVACLLGRRHASGVVRGTEVTG